MNAPYTLYGSYASYYTAKVRAYLRKKGIPFVERLPSAPRFREHIRSTSGTHRIPQLEMPDGEVLQDSIAIVDRLEALHPEVPAFPETPQQRLAVHLMELFGSEGLVRLAWQHRWFFEENDYFVKMDFGRSFSPQGSDEELMHYGNVIADRMLSRGALDKDPDRQAALDAEYVALLEKLETHFQLHPYMLGGHPSAADYALMGALHAHMGRDPAGLRVMQNHAPRVFRWIEHMLVPEIQSPEFFDRPIEYPPDDELPETFVAFLAHLATQYAEGFTLNALAWAEHARLKQNEPEGEVIAGPGEQPQLAPVEVEWKGAARELRCNVYYAWASQRAQRYYAGLSQSDCEATSSLVAIDGISGLLRARPIRWLERTPDNSLVLGDQG